MEAVYRYNKDGYTEFNITPPFEFTGIPEGTQSLGLVIEDPETVEPTGRIWTHWLVWAIVPAHTLIPEDWTVDSPAQEGENDDSGPNPPERGHTDRIRVYTLVTTGESLTANAEFERGIEGHSIEQAELAGTNGP